MFEKAEQKKLNNDESELKSKGLDFEAKQNLLGFFDLLLKVDMRINPHLYNKHKNKKENDR